MKSSGNINDEILKVHPDLIVGELNPKSENQSITLSEYGGGVYL